jgi:hypothetical protein
MSRNQSQCSVMPRIARKGGALSLLLWVGGRKPLDWKLFFLAIMVGFGQSPSRAQSGPHAGFLFDRHALTLESGSRTEAVGPFFYEQQSELAQTWALPPFFSRTEWLGGEGCEYDIAYPLLTYDRYGQEYRWQLFQLLSFAGNQSQQEIPRDRFTIFPFYFQQRSADSNQNYTALFPVYGHLQNRIFRSEIDFALWPFYVKTIKRPSVLPEQTFLTPPGSSRRPRTGELTTYNYFLPFFHLRYGDGLFGWQFWPLLGHEHKDTITKTNSWGDAEKIPGHDKRFYLWPFYVQQQRGIGSENLERELLMFPFYDRLRSPLRDSTSYLTPFGVTITEDRGKKYREVDVPWPLVVFAWGEGKTTRRVWPLFSRAHTKGFESNFYLWPAYTYRRKRGETLDRERTRLFYFLYSRTTDKSTETGLSKSRTDVWPIFTHERAADGRTRLQIFAPLEPILPASKSIERNYSPLWSIWRAENNPVTGASSQSFLWNFYRREVVPAPVKNPPLAPAKIEPNRNLLTIFSPKKEDDQSGAAGFFSDNPPAPQSVPRLDGEQKAAVGASPAPAPTKKVSLLFGLFQYESTGENRRWRLFYLPLNPSQKVSEHVPEHR